VIQATTALRKISALTKRIRVVRGGQGAGKTISILILIVNHCSSKPNREVIIASEELTKMKDSVIKDFEKVMQKAGIYEPVRFNRTEYIYRFRNGSFIKFKSLDKDDAGKGVRSHIVYFNEVNKISFEAYNQLASRADLVLADYNPDAPFFMDDEVIPREDCDFLQLTFEDNELLGSSERNEILGYKARGYDGEGNITNAYWANKWNVYGLGNIGALIGSVYNNWTIIPDIPSEARLKGAGLDFGYTNHPTALVAVYDYNGGIVIDEHLYKTEMDNQQIAALIKGSILALSNIYADKAEPKSIAEIRKCGIRIVGADKGQDSIRFGIDLIQRKTMFVTQRSVNAIAELRAYRWATDRNGKATNVPIDSSNHLLDALRYFEVGKGKYNGKYHISR
jgi:phage terminase large subunit